jgi:hypothetical protein
VVTGSVAVIAVVPTATAVARPVLLMVAVAVVAEAQVTEFVITCVVASE